MVVIASDRGMVPFLFAAMRWKRWARRGLGVVKCGASSRKSGIMEGKANPSTGAVTLLTWPRSEMMIPSLLPVLVPIVVGSSSARRRWRVLMGTS